MDDLVDLVVIGFIFVMDGIKQFKYMIMATLVVLGILFWIWSTTEDAKQACQDKGGTPISTDDGVTCVSKVIK